MKHLIVGLLFAVMLVSAAPCQQQPSTGSSSENSALEQHIRDLEDRIVALEGQVRMLKSQGAQAPPAPEPGALPAAPPLGGAGASAAKALNPDISVIGDFIGVAGHNPIQPSPSMQMHESEVGLQAIIDPYARGDFFISFGEEGVDA
jgi:hypothetical protein